MKAFAWAAAGMVGLALTGCEPQTAAEKKAGDVKQSADHAAAATRDQGKVAAEEIRNTSDKTMTGAAKDPATEAKADAVENAAERKADAIEKAGKDEAGEIKKNDPEKK